MKAVVLTAYQPTENYRGKKVGLPSANNRQQVLHSIRGQDLKRYYNASCPVVSKEIRYLYISVWIMGSGDTSVSAKLQSKIESMILISRLRAFSLRLIS